MSAHEILNLLVLWVIVALLVLRVWQYSESMASLFQEIRDNHTRIENWLRVLADTITETEQRVKRTDNYMRPLRRTPTRDQ